MSCILPPVMTVMKIELEQCALCFPEAIYAMADGRALCRMSPSSASRRPDLALGLAAGYEQDLFRPWLRRCAWATIRLGCITLAHHTPGRYGHEAQAMTTTFASYAAVAIENARLYDAAQEQAYASAALLQVAQAVVSLNDLDEILGTIIRIMPILVGVERVALYQWDAGKDVFQSFAGIWSSDEEEEETFWDQFLRAGRISLPRLCRDETGMMTCQLDDAKWSACPGCQLNPNAGSESWQPRCVAVRGSHRGEE